MKAARGVLDLVLPLRVSGDAPPLFCAHPVVGLSWCYIGMFQHFSADIPVYGLQSRGVRRPEPLPADMHEMARDFADQIRMTQPAGPYHLLGWSLGGNLAYAIAEELERRGHEIGLLAVLDASPVIPDGLRADPDRFWFLCDFVLAEFGYDPAVVAGDADPEARTLEIIRDRPGLGLQEWSDESILALLRVIRNNVVTARGYKPGRIRSGMLFFSAMQNPPELSEKLALWRPLMDGPIDVVELDCEHQHMLLPAYAERIGAEVSARMARPAARAGAEAGVV